MKSKFLSSLMMVLTLTVIVSAASEIASADLRDSTCEIGVPEASTLFIDYSFTDDGLQNLVDRGYAPYRVENTGEVSSGLDLDWGWSCRDDEGRDCTYYATIYRKSDGHDILLAHATSDSSLARAVRSLPRCEN